MNICSMNFNMQDMALTVSDNMSFPTFNLDFYSTTKVVGNLLRKPTGLSSTLFPPNYKFVDVLLRKPTGLSHPAIISAILTFIIRFRCLTINNSIF